MSILIHWFIDPVDPSWLTSTVDKDSLTGEYGPYWRSMLIHLRRITVDCRWQIKNRDNFVKGLNVIAENRQIDRSISSIQASKSQKRDFRNFSETEVCYSNGNVKFETFMYMEWSEEKFLKGILGGKTRIRFWNKLLDTLFGFTAGVRLVQGGPHFGLGMNQSYSTRAVIRWGCEGL